MKSAKFKLHWGNALALSFVFFGIFIGVLVVGSFRESIDLIEENYYEAEVNYQNRMEELQRTANLDDRPSFQSGDGAHNLYLPFPEEVVGTALFKRPDNAQLDFEMPVKGGLNPIDLSAIIPGSWIIQLHWEMNGESYFQNITHYIR
ncbi:MAG: hypothetical protein EA358_08535 [Flavobacteriales bacterium]|nr:MAG: hypothetical protein EA358_08535 [Flavobacteriales bacterium]